MPEENAPQVDGPFLSALRVSLLQLHELYQELCSVGFHSKEALYVVSQVLVEGILTRYSSPEDEYEDEEDERDDEDDDEELY